MEGDCDVGAGEFTLQVGGGRVASGMMPGTGALATAGQGGDDLTADQVYEKLFGPD